MSAIDVAQQAVRPGQLRAVIYARVSTEEQAKGYGIEAGEKRARRYIEKKDWAYITTFADEGVSGSLDWTEREDLNRLMEMAQQTPRPFDVVVVPEGRAIGRADRAYYPWVWKLEDLGVFVADAKLDIDNTTDEGRDKMREEANFAFKEYTRIRSRTQGGVQEHAEDGGYTGGYVPFAYRVENMGKKRESRLVPDVCGHGEGCRERHELPVAKRGRVLFVEHRNWDKAADLLNAESLFTRSGVPWSGNNLRNVLTGDALLHAQQVFRKKSKAKLDRNGKPLHGEEVVIDLPPVFTDQEREELKAACLMAAKGPALNGGRAYPISGRFTCLCGGTYTGWNPTGKRSPKYRCNKGGPQCKLVPAEAMEKDVWRRVQEALSDLDRLERVAAAWIGMAAQRDVNFEDRIKELDTKIERQKKTVKVTRAVAIGEALDRGLDEAEAAQEAIDAVRPLKKQLAGLEKLRADTAQWQKEATETTMRAEDLMKLAKAAQERFGRLSLEKQARLLTLLEAEVTVTASAPQGKAGVRCSLIAWFRENEYQVPELTDEAWERVKDVIPPAPGRDARRALAGMLEKVRTGVAWGKLPKEYGDGQALRKVNAGWMTGVWPAVMERLKGLPGAEPFDPTPIPPTHIRLWVMPELLLGNNVHLDACVSHPA
ncbi:recombinase family protein [Streptomyces sp. ISL-100]|uniref:recombinase family protein n=1 Tax=Streptomyces sp. ISL-100 TaxID=2819173 RepID=UPI00203512F0|nr:recombinase family protein [Streptomyces sp. ISL-100]